MVLHSRNCGILSTGLAVSSRRNDGIKQAGILTGYLVVIAKYKDLAEMEEYIDLVPILEDLSYDVDSFLSHIKEVKIREATR